MKTLFDQVKDRRELLWHHEFAATMRDTEVPVTARLSSIPHMTFFIMGFKDILFDLQKDDHGDAIQQMVNEHCQEDNGHWQWFLNDLDRLPLSESYLTQGNWRLFAELWSDANWDIRNTVYETIHLGRLAQTPRLRLLLLEVIEAIFSVYAESIRVLVEQMGYWDTFEFFGRVHYDAENDHSAGSWLDGGKNTLEADQGMTLEEQQMAPVLIHRLFERFTQMFDRWQAAQGHHLESIPKSA